jgi:putative ABC transport system permease protein
MLALTLGALRYRTASYAATFVTLFLGAVILMTFAALLDTAGTSDALVIMPSVVGGWGLVIVTFAVTSTLTLVVRQRAAELALLKSVGATPRQLGRLVVGEAAAVAVVAAGLAVGPSIVTSGWLVSMLKDTGQVPADLVAGFGPAALGIGFGVTLLGATLAATLATWRTARSKARAALLAASIERPGLGWLRGTAGTLLLLAALNCAIVTLVVLDPAEPTSMAVAAEGAVLSSIGLALLAPALLRGVLAVLGPLLRLLTGASGYLTAHNLRERAREMSGALAPIILFTGMATGTLYMQAIENGVIEHGGDYEGADTVQTLNFVVVGMIALFTAVLVVNTLISTTVHRGREFGQQRLVGSTPPQVLRMVGLESAVIAGTAVLFGTLASALTIVPYSLFKNDEVLPDVTIGIYLGVVAVAVLLTFATSLGSARRVIRVPAVRAAVAV